MEEVRTATSRFTIAVVGGAVLLGTVLGSIGGTAVALSGSATSKPEDSVAAAPTAATTASGAPLATAVPTEAPVSAPSGHAVPSSCDSLYSAGMRSTMSSAGVTLNPAWIYEPGQFDAVGTLVGDLQPILETSPKLTCTWTIASGGSEVGLTTEIVSVTDVQAAQIIDKLTSIGWTRLDELGGVRFVMQRDVEGNSVGESQFLREGLWFSTQYLNLGVNGYTADMVTQVFG
jgi:hypothetical protein